MEKMFIDFDNVDSSVAARMGFNDTDRSYSQAGVVSYRCKVYRARLDQGWLVRRTAKFAAPNEQTRDVAQS